MAVPKIVGAQRDFSAGEIDVTLKRADDHPARQKGLRQMANARVLNSGAVQNRPGRSALFPISNGCTRTEEIVMSPGNVFKIAFGNARLQIINSSGAVVFNRTTQGNGAALPWTTANLNQIVYAIFQQSIYITFGPSMRPQIVILNGGSWSIADFNELILVSAQKRTMFYRISQQGVTVQPSGTSGAITVTFGAPLAVAGMTGTRIRYCGRQIILGSLISSTQMNATVVESLPPGQNITLSNAVGAFNLGDEVQGTASGAIGIVAQSPAQQAIHFNGPTGILVGDHVTGGTSGATGICLAVYANPLFNTSEIVVQLSTSTLFVNNEVVSSPNGSNTSTQVSSGGTVVQLLPSSTGFTNAFTINDLIVGPAGSSAISVTSVTTPQAVTNWDDEVMNSFRGFPGSVFVDQFRVGFCNFPSLPNFIAWSAINSPGDLYVGALSSNAIFVPVPDKAAQVLFVTPGPESAEFVLCDRKIYYIPINQGNPLSPSTVSFQVLSGDGAAQVQPRSAQELIFYVGAGGNSIKAIIAPGMTNRPFNTRDVSQFHTHLFNNVTLLAVQTADSTFAERYVYALNNNGSVVSGKYSSHLVENDAIVGWGPWSGNGTVTWIAANQADVLFTTSYFGTPICEIVDDTQYLDAGLFVNNLPSAFTPPGGKGPLWWIPSQTVSLIDQGYRSMGTYSIDANGNLIAQNNAGEDFTVSTLVAGQPWTAIIEPFVPDASPGQSAHQRMFKRRVSRMAVYVVNSTGFLLARLFSGPLTRTSPALGSIVNQRRFTAWNQDDDPTKPPPLREGAERMRPLGRSFDARVVVIKDTPGSLQIPEIGLEASI